MKRILTILFASLLAALPAAAAPPFVTDDPAPVDYQHVELDFFAQTARASGNTGGVLPAVEIDYGALPDLELHLVAPMAYSAPRNGSFHYGYGDTEFGFKYKLVHQDTAGWLPDISIAPAVDAPTGDAARGLGNGNTREFFPLWLERDWSNWQAYGGGGYWNNPGFENRNFWFAGWVLQRQITPQFALGGEVFHQTSDRIGAPASTGFNLGGIYDLNEHYHILLSAGRGLQNAQATNQFSSYADLQLTY